MRLDVNGRTHDVRHPTELLLWVLRDELGLTGTHYGCGIGVCGCCTVLLDGAAVRSCQLRANQVAGRDVVTLEGLATRQAGGEVRLHPVQQAFLDNPLQCGWCLPGHVLCAVELLQRTPTPNDQQIDESANRNLCRCGGYNSIRAAVRQASAAGTDDESA